MNAFTHSAIMLLGDRDVAVGIMDAERPPLGVLRNRHAACIELDAYAHALTSELARHEQEDFVAAALYREPIRLLRIAEFLAHWNHEDQTTGGAGKPYRQWPRCDRNYDPKPARAPAPVFPQRDPQICKAGGPVDPARAYPRDAASSPAHTDGHRRDGFDLGPASGAVREAPARARRGACNIRRRAAGKYGMKPVRLLPPRSLHRESSVSSNSRRWRR